MGGQLPLWQALWALQLPLAAGHERQATWDLVGVVMEGGQRHATHVLAGYICVIGLGKSYSMPLSMRARREAAPRPPEAGNILRREPPGHTQYRAERRACNEPPSGPCCSQACRRAGAPAAQQPHRNSIGCQTCKAVRKWASRGHLHTHNAGGWAVAGGRFPLTVRLGLMFYAASRPAHAPNRHPPRPPEAPRRARGSPLCARGTATVSGGA